MSQKQTTKRLTLTDDGLETPEYLLGFTGQLGVETPTLSMTCHISDPGLGERSDIILSYPETGDYNGDLEAGEIIIDGRKYEVVDAREDHEDLFQNESGHETTEPEKATTGTIEESD